MALLLLLSALPAVVQAQFTYTNNYGIWGYTPTNGTTTITGYTGPGGAVTIPSTINGLPVASIGNAAFYQCTSLTNVTIPNSVTNIGYEAFESCYNLTSVTIGINVTTIRDAAFESCGNLGSITIPNSVTSIGNGAFYGCFYRSPTSVTIPNSVTSIGDYAFGACADLIAITVDALNPAYSSVAGVLFNKSQTTLVQYPIGKTGSYTIPNSVTNIGDYAFEDCSLANLTIPSSVTSIGDYAFYDCYSLTSVTISNSVTNIGKGAFGWCTSLTSVRIPSSVTNIGNQAFSDCDRLTAITVDSFNSVYSSADGVLFKTTEGSLIQYPGGKAGAYSIANSTTSIGDWAFDDCYSLASVTIPNSVTNIGNQAFEDCNLTSITIPNSVIRIESAAFLSCGVTNVTIGNSVTSIGDLAFAECESLTIVTIGNSLTNLGFNAFSYCMSLTGVYFQGNAPSLSGSAVFKGDDSATVYYLQGTTGWSTTFGGLPTALWTQMPAILSPPRTQTAEVGSAVGLGVKASGSLPLSYLWYLNSTNLLSCSTNSVLELTSVQFAHAGAYTVVVTNAAGAITSSPAVLNVIAAVERRPVPGLKLMGQPGTSWDVVCADSLGPAPSWTRLASVTLSGAPQYCFDLAQPLPPQRFYRAQETADPFVLPVLDLRLVPEITLAGKIGDSVRVDYINRFGPIDAWITLATVTLTNTSQLYFDVSAPGQPQRLYRIVPSP